MKKKLVVTWIISGILISQASSQTIDFTISLFLKFKINESICPDLAGYKDLITLPRGKDSCVFKCNLNNIKTQSDSIILSVGWRSIALYDFKVSLEFKQYFHVLDSAILEYNEYINGLMQQFDSYPDFYRYTYTNELLKNKYLAKNNYKADLISLRSLYIWAIFHIRLAEEKGKYVVYTKIN